MDDIAAAVDHLRANGIAMDEPERIGSGPAAGSSWVYFRAPWGLQMELVSYPGGKAYERDAGVRLWHPARPSE